jgi:hypothetical protein
MDIDNKESAYHCTIEWHLARLVPLAAVLYPFAYRISKASHRFHCSALNLAQHFGVSEWTVLRAIRALQAAGLFILLAKEPFKPSVYQVVSHKEWAAIYPGLCAVKTAYPWSEEGGDQLGIRLHNASGGRVKYQPHKLTALRNTGFTEDEIVSKFEQFVASENARREAKHWYGRWSAVPFRFLQYLNGKLSQEELARLGLEPCAGRQDTQEIRRNEGKTNIVAIGSLASR